MALMGTAFIIRIIRKMIQKLLAAARSSVSCHFCCVTRSLFNCNIRTMCLMLPIKKHKIRVARGVVVIVQKYLHAAVITGASV